MDNSIYIIIFLPIILIIIYIIWTKLLDSPIAEVPNNSEITTVPKTTVPTTAPVTTVQRTTTPITTVQRTTTPITTVQRTTAPVTTVQRTTTPVTTVRRTTAPVTTVQRTTTPVTTVRRTTTPVTTVRRTTTPVTTVRRTTTPVTTVPKTTVPKTTVPKTTVPKTTVPKTTVPKTTVPKKTVPKKYKFYGMSISFFNNKKTPDILNDSSVLDVLNKIKDITPIIKLYNTTYIDMLLRIITTNKLNLKVFINIWTDVKNSKTLLDSNIDVLIDIIKKYGTLNIDAISLSNEAFLRGKKYSKEDGDNGLLNIANGINRIREELKTIKFNGKSITIPQIGICETEGFFTNRHNNFYNLDKYRYLMQRLDFIGANIHPMYHVGSHIIPDTSVDETMKTYNRIKDSINKNYPNIKDIMITEVGLPTEGVLGNKNVPFTKEKTKEYMKKITQEMFNQNIKYYWFSGFDSGGKVGPLFEKKWGLFTMESDPNNPTKYYQNQKFDISDLPNRY